MCASPRLHCWQVGPDFEFGALGAYGTLRAEAPEQENWELVDDYDWTLWAGGRALLVCGEKILLVSRDEDGATVTTATCLHPPFLPSELPKGALKRSVVQVTKRPLLARLPCVCIRRRLVLVNTTGKTTARGWSESWGFSGEGARATELGLQPLRGYAKEVARVLGEMDELGDRCSPGAALFSALAASAVGSRVPESDVQIGSEDAGPCLRDAIVGLLANCWHNEAGVVDGVDPQCLHHYRVGLRRARVLAGEGREVLGGCAEEAAGLLQAIAEKTGVLRDLDVLVECVSGDCPPLLAGVSDCGDGVREFLARERRHQLGLLRRYLCSRRHSARRERLGALLVAENSPAPPIHALDFVSERVGRRAVRLERACRKACRAATDKRLHKVRVQVKKLRYLLASSHQLLGGDRVDSWLRRLSGVQGSLGKAHDLAVAAEWFAASGAGREGEVAGEPHSLAQALAGKLRSSRIEATRQIGALRQELRHFDSLAKENSG